MIKKKNLRKKESKKTSQAPHHYTTSTRSSVGTSSNCNLKKEPWNGNNSKGPKFIWVSKIR